MQSILNVFIGGFIFSSCVLAGICGTAVPFVVLELVKKLSIRAWRAIKHEKN